MYPFFVALHVSLCLFLIAVILLQPGKGGDVGAAFGGGASNSLFGPRGPAGLLQRATTVVAILFMATSVTLALYSNRAVLSDANVEQEIERLQELENEGDAPAPVEEPTVPPEAQAPKRRGR